MKHHVKSLFDEHDQPRHISKRVVHDTLAPVNRAVTDMRKQVLEYQALVSQLENADGDVGLDGQLEHMQQTFGAIERECSALAEHSRECAKWFKQLDRYMVNAKQAMIAKLAESGETLDDLPDTAEAEDLP